MHPFGVKWAGSVFNINSYRFILGPAPQEFPDYPSVVPRDWHFDHDEGVFHEPSDFYPRIHPGQLRLVDGKVEFVDRIAKRERQRKQHAERQRARPHGKPVDNDDEAKRINRQTLVELQAAAKLSDDQIYKVERKILAKAFSKTRPSEKYIGNHNLDEVDNKYVRSTVREWITKNVPHNKQPAVRDAVFLSLTTLVPPQVQSHMWTMDSFYKDGESCPPGFEDIPPSEYSSEEDGPSAKRRRKS